MVGITPQGKVVIKWSPGFAYAIGLLATDGNLSKDGRHISLTSKDKSQIDLFRRCLGIKNSIGRKSRSKGDEKKYFYVQFGDVLFYQFLLSIGLSPRKSKTIFRLTIPEMYFYDFLRGHLDGDGTFYSYWDKRWRSSFMFYTVFISASLLHLNWIREEIKKRLNIVGHITHDDRKSTYHLKYAKRDSLLLLPMLYKNGNICLRRKRLKISKALTILGKSL